MVKKEKSDRVKKISGWPNLSQRPGSYDTWKPEFQLAYLWVQKSSKPESKYFIITVTGNVGLLNSLDAKARVYTSHGKCPVRNLIRQGASPSTCLLLVTHPETPSFH